jgi:hypothetical protein
MRKKMLAAVSAAAVLSAGSLIPSRAEATIGTPAAVNLAAEAVAPVENVWWCGWRCHHRFLFFHHRFHQHVFFHHRFHHRFAFAHRCTWC